MIYSFLIRLWLRAWALVIVEIDTGFCSIHRSSQAMWSLVSLVSIYLVAKSLCHPRTSMGRGGFMFAVSTLGFRDKDCLEASPPSRTSQLDFKACES